MSFESIRKGLRRLMLPVKAAPATPLVYLDVSRLLREKSGRHTGISRVELRYLQHLIAHPRIRLRCVRQQPDRFVVIPHFRITEHLRRVGWPDLGFPEPVSGERPRAVNPFKLKRALERGIYLNASHSGLEETPLFVRIRAELGWRMAYYVHDLIPIEYPSLTGPGNPERHIRRMLTVAHTADLVVVNSQATADSFARFTRAYGFPEIATEIVRIGAAPNPLSASPGKGPELPRAPYFLSVSTIEPRKNYALLIRVWRRLHDELGSATPLLVIVGRRGWLEHAVFDELESAQAAGVPILELNDVADSELERLYVGAHALLMPSWAEGWGMPIAEALTAGTMVIASDIPAHREVASAAATFLDPRDDGAWCEAVRRVSSSANKPAPGPGFQPVSWVRELEQLDLALDAQTARLRASLAGRASSRS